MSSGILSSANMLLCGVSASRRDDERAHFAGDTLDGACAKAKLAGYFQNAFARPQLALDSPFHIPADLRPAERRTPLHGPL